MTPAQLSMSGGWAVVLCLCCCCWGDEGRDGQLSSLWAGLVAAPSRCIACCTEPSVVLKAVRAVGCCSAVSWRQLCLETAIRATNENMLIFYGAHSGRRLMAKNSMCKSSLLLHNKRTHRQISSTNHRVWWQRPEHSHTNKYIPVNTNTQGGKGIWNHDS